MRRYAERHDLRGLEVHDHIAWAFDGHERFLSAVVPFLRDGLELDQRLLYVVDDPNPADLAELGDVAQLEVTGALQIVRTPDYYGGVGHLSIDDQLATFGSTIEEARTDGFDGIRVAAGRFPPSPIRRHSGVGSSGSTQPIPSSSRTGLPASAPSIGSA